jgi:hypothetical protein
MAVGEGCDVRARASAFQCSPLVRSFVRSAGWWLWQQANKSKQKKREVSRQYFFAVQFSEPYSSSRAGWLIEANKTDQLESIARLAVATVSNTPQAPATAQLRASTDNNNGNGG